MIPQNLLPLVNHLWQSTVFAAAVALLAVTLRRNRAQARFWLWYAASLKFLIPFSFLVSLGRSWALPPHASVTETRISAAVEQFGQAFAATPQLFSSPVPESTHLGMATLLLAIWACGFGTILFRWLREWMRVSRAVCKAKPLELNAPVPVRSSAQLMEPGVFGLFRPVLLLPDGITDRLVPEQLAAIVAHELCHIKRRDNLTAALHMVVESLFWFHPIVWWIGARMVQEREHACDEEVLRQGNKPDTYAEGILNVCRFCLESPLPCVAGVTGSNLRKRIEAIMTQRLSDNLNTARKMLLAAVGLAAIAGPVTLGVLHTSLSRAQTAAAADKPLEFEVATVKQSAPIIGDLVNINLGTVQNGVATLTNATLSECLRYAYGLVSEEQISGPDWINSRAVRFDIVAKAPVGADTGTLPLMMQTLLAERLKVVLHHEPKTLTYLALTVGKNGAQLKPAIVGGRRISVSGRISSGEMTMGRLAMLLSRFERQIVVDQTGLRGDFTVQLEWTPENRAAVVTETTSGISLFSALQQQLGLKLESRKGPLDVLVIDHAAKIPLDN